MAKKKITYILNAPGLGNMTLSGKDTVIRRKRTRLFVKNGDTNLIVEGYGWTLIEKQEPAPVEEEEPK